MLRTGQLLRPASNPASRPRTGASLPGTLASPRTGLTPAGYPQLVARLHHHNLLPVMAPELLDAPPKRRAPRRPVRSDLAVDRHLKGGAYLPHPLAAQSAESLDQHCDRDALDRVEIDSRKPGDRVRARFEEDLARKVPDIGCAGGDQGAAQSGDGSVPGQDKYRTSANVREFAPPEFPSTSCVGHVAAAAERNDSRSPHSSGLLIGCSSYASYAESISAAR